MRLRLKKTCAVVLCLGILALAVPGTSAYERKAPKLNLIKFFAQQADAILTFLGFVPVFKINAKIKPDKENSGSSNNKIKGTGGLNHDRVGGGN